ncbi:MAG: redoxin family protein [Eubacteriales bacterium]|nr:redoxin family protein [Eubacteriales bacterium]
MDNKESANTSWLKSRRPTKRRLIQLYSALLYNAYVKGFIKGDIYTGKTKALCVPGLNCYSCPAAIGACPLGSLQNALASSGNRVGFYVFGIIMLWGLMLGRTVCGWICPMGLIQELLHKIPTPKIRKSRVTYYLSYLKYLFLSWFAVALPMWYGLKRGITVPAFCKYICPAGTLEGAMALLANPNNAGFFRMLGLLFTRKFVIMVFTGLLCIFSYRSFCRFICPLGAIYGMFSKLALVGVRVDMDRCTHCGACAINCKMDVRHVGDHECINCTKCMEVCKQGAISLKAGKITLKAPADGCVKDMPEPHGKRTGTGRLALWAAIAVLAFALLWYNVLDNTGAASEISGKDEIIDQLDGTGNQPGYYLPDFTIECMDRTQFHLYDNRGKVVFINLWATYCGPCVQELPCFNELAATHEGDVEILAVHNSMSTEDIPAYLSDKGWNNLHFALDTNNMLVWNIVGGGSAMPQTIVIDLEGKVIYNQVGSVTPELLEDLFVKASGNGL